MNYNKSENPGHEWPQPQDFKKSIRIQFLFYVSIMILVLMSIAGYVITDQFVETVTQHIVEKQLVQARSYSGTAGKLILSANGPDALLLNNTCMNLINDNPDIFWAGITGRDNHFIAHSNMQKVIASDELEMIGSAGFENLLQEGEVLSVTPDTIGIAVPIMENAILVGWLGVSSSTRQISEARRTSIVTVATTTILVIILGVPLVTIFLGRKLRPIGVITDHLKQMDFNNIKLDIPVVTRNEFGYLAETLRVMGTKVSIAQNEVIERERMARDLEIANEIQTNLLPDYYPKEEMFELAGAYESAREVGGDYYDFIDYDDRHHAFLVADVSGKSLPGMLVMLLTREIVKKLARTCREPAQLLSEVNRELLSSIKKGMFVTMFFGILDKQSGLFKYASAGHNPLIHIDGTSGKQELLNPKGYPLGMMPATQFDKRIESGQLQLEKGDWLVQYTDGVNEAQNSAGEEFGMERFLELLDSLKHNQPAELVQGLLKGHREYVGKAEQFDDITLIVMKWSGSSADNRVNIVRKVENAGQV